MFHCPHCNKPIETAPAQRTIISHYDSGPMRLGCGTLILIAIIVLIFSRGGDNSAAIRELRTEIQNLESKIDRLSSDRAGPAAGQGDGRDPD